MRIVDRPSSLKRRQFAEIAEIPEGKALLIGWDELTEYADGARHIRVLAHQWGRRLGVCFRTRKSAAGMYVFRARTR
jgi:hypothetical protein